MLLDITAVVANPAVSLVIAEPSSDHRTEDKLDSGSSMIDTLLNCKVTDCSIEIGGNVQIFSRKTFSMDPPSTSLQFYVDIELRDKLETLYHYNVLSVHLNKTLRTIYYSRSCCIHRLTAKKHIVLCILRTKCDGPRYDVVLQDVESGTVFRSLTLAKFRASYIYLPNEIFADELTAQTLNTFFIENDMVWNKTRPNKLDDGKPDHEGWEKLMGLGNTTMKTIDKRKQTLAARKQTVSSSSKNVAAAEIFKKQSITSKPATKVNKSVVVQQVEETNNDLKKTQNLSNKRKVIEVVDEEEDEDEDDVELLQLRAQVEKKKLKAEHKKKEKAKLLAELKQLDDMEEDYVDEIAPVAEEQVKFQQKLSSSATSLKQVPTLVSTSTACKVPHNGKLSFMQLQAMQEQTRRIDHMHHLQMRTALMENMLLSNQWCE